MKLWESKNGALTLLSDGLLLCIDNTYTDRVTLEETIELAKVIQARLSEKKKTHIPASSEVIHDIFAGDLRRTYCGRLVKTYEVIDLKTTPLDDATCQSCQKSDEWRAVQAYLEASKRDEKP